MWCGNCACQGIPLLQRRPCTPWSRWVLANDSIFSCGEVHCSKEDSTGISQVVCSPAFELGVLTGCHSCGMWCP